MSLPSIETLKPIFIILTDLVASLGFEREKGKKRKRRKERRREHSKVNKLMNTVNTLFFTGFKLATVKYSIQLLDKERSLSIAWSVGFTVDLQGILYCT